MKRFQFPLRAVAVMRANRELRAREGLAAAQRLRAEAEGRLHEARSQAERTAATLTAARRQTSRAGDQAVFSAWHRREWLAAVEAENRVMAANAEVGRRRDECVEAQRQLKIVTRLEECARAAHRVASLAAEQVEIDEVAGQRRARKKVCS